MDASISCATTVYLAFICSVENSRGNAAANMLENELTNYQEMSDSDDRG